MVKVVGVLPILFLFSIFLVALPSDDTDEASQLAEQKTTPRGRRPLCASQFALVNYACARVPSVPFPPPSPPPADDLLPPEHRNPYRSGQRHDNQSHSHGHSHSRSHSQSHSHRHPAETPEQRYCCQWMKLVDTECICDVLVRLPAFLSKYSHQYTLVVDETCRLTYECAGRVIPIP